MRKWILHADMNSCYASIEQARRPWLKGKAVAVGGSKENRNGVILAKSIEAKKKGVKTGEVIWQAQIKCPELIIIPADFPLYMAYSAQAQSIYREYTDRVEPFGIDECWLDVTGSEPLFGDGEEIASRLRERFKEELDITISVGISDNKIFAKLGSDYKKPDAQTRIDRSNYKEIAWPLAVEKLLNCGPKSKKKLNRLGIWTIGDLAQADPHLIRKILGVNGIRLWISANGRDDTPVAKFGSKEPVKSIGCGTTFRRDLKNEEEVKLGLTFLAQQLEKKLIKKGLAGKALSLSVRDNLLCNHDNKKELAYALQNAGELVDYGFDIFRDFWSWEHPVRAMTLRAYELVAADEPVQGSFFYDLRSHEKKERLSHTLYELKRKYGPRSVRPASMQNFEKADLLRTGKSFSRITMPRTTLLAHPLSKFEKI